MDNPLEAAPYYNGRWLSVAKQNIPTLSTIPFSVFELQYPTIVPTPNQVLTIIYTIYCL